MENPSKKQRESTVIIVGAGPAGLATAASLTQLSIPYILLEKEDCIASLWKQKSYDRLHLHLPKQYSELPFMKLPTSFPNYVPRKDFIQYLDNYADHFHIKPFHKRQVKDATFDEELKKWRVKATSSIATVTEEGEVVFEEEFLGRFLVVATGLYCDPFCPPLEGLSSFQGKVIHSTDFKSGKEYKGRSVLVVGAGNSGMEIALDLATHGAHTSIVVRSPIHILSRSMVNLVLSLNKYFPYYILDILIVTLSKLVFGDITKYDLSRPTDGPCYLKSIKNKVSVIDVGTFDKIKSGEIKVLPAITSIRGNTVLFEDGRTYAFETIIFATGFKRSTNLWLKGDEYLLNEDGQPKPAFPNHWKGKNGLYCAGLTGFGLTGCGMDAQNIAKDVKSKIESSIYTKQGKT